MLLEPQAGLKLIGEDLSLALCVFHWMAFVL